MARWAWLFVAIGLTLATAVVVPGLATAQVVVVETADGTELVSVPAEDGTEVTIEYTHSVERTPVRDVYVVDDGDLVMDRTEFRSFGAGLPSHASGQREGDAYVHRPPDQRHETLIVATGHVAGHDLVVEGRRYDVSAAADGGTVRLEVQTRYRL